MTSLYINRQTTATSAHRSGGVGQHSELPKGGENVVTTRVLPVQKIRVCYLRSSSNIFKAKQ